MLRGAFASRWGSSLRLADAVLRAIRATTSVEELAALMETVTCEIGFLYYALIHHADLRVARAGRVDIRRYPAAVSERIVGQGYYRRDPVIRGCLYAGSAYLWTELGGMMELDARDRASFEFGSREGLNEGITVPCLLHGDRIGSCTFAGTRMPDRACRFLGPAQMIGVFAFQAARRLVGATGAPQHPPRLHPRPRDCVMLAGRGLSNKQIARALGLTPRTVDGYLTEARQLYDAHDRTQLVVEALLAGEVGLDELKRQPE